MLRYLCAVNALFFLHGFGAVLLRFSCCFCVCFVLFSVCLLYGFCLTLKALFCYAFAMVLLALRASIFAVCLLPFCCIL